MPAESSAHALSGMADLFGAAWFISAIGLLTFTSGAVVAVAMTEHRQEKSMDKIR